MDTWPLKIEQIEEDPPQWKATLVRPIPASSIYALGDSPRDAVGMLVIAYPGLFWVDVQYTGVVRSGHTGGS